jgi:hypothetical protein
MFVVGRRTGLLDGKEILVASDGDRRTSMHSRLMAALIAGYQRPEAILDRALSADGRDSRIWRRLQRRPAICSGATWTAAVIANRRRSTMTLRSISFTEPEEFTPVRLLTALKSS